MYKECPLLSRVLRATIPIFILVTASCASTPSSRPNVIQPVVVPAFPPQEAMQSGNYLAFLTENQIALDECKEDEKCAVSLFNLGFVHGYPISPYYNPTKALTYFEQIIQKYPQSPWSFQAKAWTYLLNRSINSDSSRQRLLGELKSKDATIRELQKLVEQSKQVDKETDQKRKELLERIERSRQVDMEMDRKERELLQ